MYIAGTAQTLVMADGSGTMKSPCPGAHVTNEQIVDVVVKWLDDHPETRDPHACSVYRDEGTELCVPLRAVNAPSSCRRVETFRRSAVPPATCSSLVPSSP